VEITFKPIGEQEEDGPKFRPVAEPSIQFRPIEDKAPLQFYLTEEPEVPADPVNLDPLSKYKGTLTRDQILADDDLFDQYIVQPLTVRFGFDYRNKFLLDQDVDLNASKEEILDQFLNYQRSFAGGQTLTTASEVTFMQGATEEDKAMVGRGYVLFDKMPNIFSKDSTWGNMWDGMGDYTRAAVVDPMTPLGLGVGRMVGATGTWATAKAIRLAGISAAREALKEGATREVAQQAMKQTARKAMLYQGAVNATTLAAIDLPAAIGADIGYQFSLMEGGVQEEYKPSQTAVAALGTVALPALVAGFKGVKWLTQTEFAQGTPFAAYKDIYKKFGSQMNKEAVEEAVMEQLDTDLIRQRVAAMFGGEEGVSLGGLTDSKGAKAVEKRLDTLDKTVQKRLDDIAKGAIPKPKTPDGTPEAPAPTATKPVVPDVSGRLGQGVQDVLQAPKPKSDWDKALEEGVKVADEVGGINIAPGETKLMNEFLFGTPEKESFLNILKDAGLVFVPRNPQDIQTDFIGDIISKLPESFISGVFDGTDSQLKGITPKKLGAYFKLRQSMAGTDLQQSNVFRRPKTLGDFFGDKNSGNNPAAHKERLLYLQSSWKRMVTASLSTTGANVKGWSFATAANSLSDVVEGLLFYGGPLTRKGRGLIASPIKRATASLNWLETSQQADQFFKVRPDVGEKLARFINAGVDSGTNPKEILRIYGLDENSPLNLGNEKVIKFLQDVTGVTLQDELTKRVSFMAALDTELMKKFGYGYNDMMSQKNGYLKLFKPEMEDVIFKAVDRARRETFSKPFSEDSYGKGVFRTLAREVERWSNTPGIGIIIPFGQFLNNSTAFVSDYSGFSAFYHVLKKGYAKVGGTVDADFREESFQQLFSKAVVGMTIAGAYFMPKELEKMEQGLRWNEEESYGGHLIDTTLDAPYPYFAIMGRILAHKIRDGEVPPDLTQEAFDLFIGQTTREVGQAGQSATEFIKSFFSLATEDIMGAFGQAISGTLSQFASGYSRPFDTVNQFTAMLTDNFEALDRRQGVKGWNESIRYIDQMFAEGSPLNNLPLVPERPQELRKYATANTPKQDFGKTISGMREAAPPSAANRMLAAVGKSPWNSVKWQGEYPQLKNHLDSIINPIINKKAEQIIAANDFFNLPLRQQERLVSALIEDSREETMKIFAEGSNRDPLLNRMYTIYGYSARERDRAMSQLGIDDMKIEDLATMPNGIARLEQIIYLLQNPD